MEYTYIDCSLNKGKEMRIIILTLTTIFLFSTITNAQFEVKGNPIGLVWGSPNIALEYVVSDKLGIEVTPSFLYGSVAGAALSAADPFDQKFRGYRLRLALKYYFNPVTSGDGLYAGPYFGPRSSKYTADADELGYNPNYKQSAFSVGAIFGYKYMIDSGLFFELQAGLGWGIGAKLEYEDPEYDELINNVLDNPIGDALLGFEGVRSVSIGYRFNHNTKKKKKKKRRRR